MAARGPTDGAASSRVTREDEMRAIDCPCGHHDGRVLVAACATVTAANLCLPSEAVAWRARHTERKHPITT